MLKVVFIVFQVCAFYPEVIAFEYLWYLGDFLLFISYAYSILPKLVFYFTCIVHLGEGLYAFKLVRLVRQSQWCTSLAILSCVVAVAPT